MVELRGNPLYKLGVTAQDCSSQIGAVPLPCEPCRQTNRWLPRTVSWTSAQYSKFKSIMKAILDGHDEILQSLCGFCADQTVQTCECFVAEYTLLGLPLEVEIEATEDNCVAIKKDITFPDACNGGDMCLKEHCTLLCTYCDIIALDACNNPDHLSIMLRAVAASKAGFGRRATGATMLAVVQALFPDTTPVIRHVEKSTIYVDIGRIFTVPEIQFLKFFTSLIPTGFGVKIKFVTVC